MLLTDSRGQVQPYIVNSDLKAAPLVMKNVNNFIPSVMVLLEKYWRTQAVCYFNFFNKLVLLENREV